ncbi:MAG: hypothetical protein F6K14_02705 [Symploca sp. SIO2C1]|nr:hypothetical protein [Symploca sp. SIO2C1]
MVHALLIDRILETACKKQSSPNEKFFFTTMHENPSLRVSASPRPRVYFQIRRQEALREESLYRKLFDLLSLVGYFCAALVDAILRSRKICRSPRGQPLSGVSLEIYQQVRSQLLQYEDAELETF